MEARYKEKQNKRRSDLLGQQTDFYSKCDLVLSDPITGRARSGRGGMGLRFPCCVEAFLLGQACATWYGSGAHTHTLSLCTHTSQQCSWIWVHVVCGWIAGKKQEGGGESIMLCCKGETLAVDQAGNKLSSYMHRK